MQKKRTHVADDDGEGVAKSFIVRRGRVGAPVQRLVEDMRHVMYPNTAMHLKESKKNAMKDFVSVAGPLGVTHLIAFSATDWATYMKIGRLPRGPSLSFKVEEFSLMTDISARQERPRPPGGPEYKASPLVMLTNFAGEENTKKMMGLTFQSMFPSLNVHKVKFPDCRRAVLLDYNAEKNCVYFRHYYIEITSADASAAVRQILSKKKTLNLRNLEDVSQLFDKIKGEEEKVASSTEWVVELCSSFYKTDMDPELKGKKWKKRKFEARKKEEQLPPEENEKFLVSLQELGPRMTLSLTKIQQDLFDGEVLYHAFVKKSKDELNDLRQKAKLKEERRKEQEANVAKKKGEAEKGKGKERENVEMEEEEEEEEEERSYEEFDQDELEEEEEEGDRNEEWEEEMEEGQEVEEEG